MSAEKAKPIQPRPPPCLTKADPLGDVRFRKAYDAIASADDRVAALRNLSDEDVIAALAAAAERRDALLANILATEAMNRIRTLRASLAHMGEGVVTLDLGLRIVWLNTAAERLLGAPHQALVGRPFLDVVHHIDAKGEHIAMHESVIHRARIGEIAASDDGFFLTEDGRRFCVTISAAPIRASDGTTEAVVLAFRDCTDRQQAQELLSAERERYKSLFDLAPEAIVSVDRDGVILDSNPATQRLTGRPGEDAIGHSFADFVHPEDIDRAFATLEDVVAGRREETTIRVLHANGSYVLVNVTGIPVLSGGEVIGVHGIVRPVADDPTQPMGNPRGPMSRSLTE